MILKFHKNALKIVDQFRIMKLRDFIETYQFNSGWNGTRILSWSWFCNSYFVSLCQFEEILIWNWFFHNYFFFTICLQFLSVNCSVSRRTFLGNRQNIPKNAKKAKTGGRQSKIRAPTENITLVVLPNDLEHFAKDKCYFK